MPRFFYQPVVSPDQMVIEITGDDYHHIRDVLRLRHGDGVTICDGSGSDLSGRISRMDDRAVIVEILERKSNQSEPLYRVTLYQGLAKGDKMETIIQKSVELGVARVVPMISKRCIAVPDERDYPKKLTRWNRIAAEAAKQCGRGMIPSVGPILTFEQVLADSADAAIRLIPWEQERDRSIRTVLERWQHGSTAGIPDTDVAAGTSAQRPEPALAVLIGPEGGFTETEVLQASAAGIQPVTLGRRILRTETAGPAILAMLLYQFNDF